MIAYLAKAVVLSFIGAGALAAVAGMLAEDGDAMQPQGTSQDSASAEFTYVGTKKCRMCHSAQHESWRELPKGNSWAALKPGASREIKQRAGLDTQKDYTQEATCLACHSVGYGRPGGYAVPSPADARSVRAAAAREGAGCESCHGPGSGFVKVMEKAHRSREKPRPEDLLAAGRKPVTQQVCKQCHNEGAVCMMIRGSEGTVGPAKDLRVDVADRRGYHEKSAVLRRPSDANESDDD